MNSQTENLPVEQGAPAQPATLASIPGPGGRMAAMGALAAVALFGTWWPNANASDSTQPDQAVVAVVADGGQAAVDLAAPITANPVAPVEAVTPIATESPIEPAAAVVSTTQPEAVEPAGAEPAANAAENTEVVAEQSEPAEPAEATLEPGQIFVDQFSDEDPAWNPLTGRWGVSDGLLVQSDPGGFDFINQLDLDVPEQFDLRVRMRASSPELGGGVVLGQLAPGSRKGAYLIDFTAGGSFLRWGRYNPESGVYEYLGGIDVGIDGTEWHELQIEVRTDSTLVYLDDAYIGAFEAIAAGDVGLAASMSSVEFDDLVISEAS